MEWRLCKAVGTLFVLVLLFSVMQRLLPKTLWVLLFLATLTYGISLLFSLEIPALRRWAVAYLVLVGAMYFLAGLLGLFPNWGLIVTSMWYDLISPYPLLTLIDQCIFYRPCKLSGTPFSVLPATDEPQIFFSTAAILVSLTAIIAAFFLAKGNRIAHRVWLALVAFSFAEALVYVLVDFANWGSLPRAGTQSQESIIPLGWAASYLAAFLTVRFEKARPKSTSLNDGH